ncbi:MAG: hypothetical protein JWM74_3069 [Myxococcaceae bacterium]|jgi:hypothetical protein|nr:hypothetical protein [Myxococcaceae bacterium]
MTLARALDAARAAHAAIAGDPTMDAMRGHVDELARRARAIDTMKDRVVAVAAIDEIIAALRLVLAHGQGRGGPVRSTPGARGNAGDPMSVVLRELALRQEALAEVEGDALRATG